MNGLSLFFILLAVFFWCLDPADYHVWMFLLGIALVLANMKEVNK
jgi:hypothetical protein